MFPSGPAYLNARPHPLLSSQKFASWPTCVFTSSTVESPAREKALIALGVAHGEDSSELEQDRPVLYLDLHVSPLRRMHSSGVRQCNTLTGRAYRDHSVKGCEIHRSPHLVRGAPATRMADDYG